MKEGMKVLYMGEHTWHICTITKRVKFNTFMLKPVDPRYLPFSAPVSRCVEVPKNVDSIEQVVDALRRMENWNDPKS